MTKRYISAAAVIAALIAVSLFLHSRQHAEPVLPIPVVAKPIPVAGPKHEIIGTSVQGRSIEAYTFGTGPVHIVLAGGMHGGYEWNSVLLAYSFMDYFSQHPQMIPAKLSVTIIPDLNPDGVFAVTGKVGRFDISDVSTDAKILAAGRFNANGVDLNRNFDCKWQPKSMWQSKTVSAGTAAFSEPEAASLKKYLASQIPSAVVFWHSQANAVYASQCKNGILSETMNIMNAYADAAHYPKVKTFDAYPTTGAADDWLASVGVPAVTVELSTHSTIEWGRNLAGVTALMSEVAGVTSLTSTSSVNRQ